jgi:four helix bundle protein
LLIGDSGKRRFWPKKPQFNNGKASAPLRVVNEQAETLKQRTKQFALAVIALVRTFPAGEPARTVGGQLARSATSVGANYRSACRARSHADFVAKIALVEEEADESGYWLEVAKASSLVSSSAVEPLLKEADELTAIFARSTMTARQSANRQ